MSFLLNSFRYGGGASNIALVAHTGKGGVPGLTTTAINTTGANLIVCVVSGDASNNLLVTDSKSNVWTQLTRYTQGSQRLAISYCAAPTVGSGHTFSSDSFASMDVIAVSGAAAIPIDGSNGANNASGTTIATGSVTPSLNGSLIVAGLGSNDAATEPSSINNGFTITDPIPFLSGQHYGVNAAYLIQVTAAAINPTWTVSSSDPKTAAIAVFKPA